MDKKALQEQFEEFARWYVLPLDKSEDGIYRALETQSAWMSFQHLQAKVEELQKRVEVLIQKYKDEDRELKRQKELDELYGQLVTPRFNTTDINAIRKRAIPQELWKDQKVKELEDENKELKRQLALKTLAYK